MKYFDQLKINSSKYEATGYFQSQQQTLIVNCVDLLSFFNSWKYDEVIIEKLDLIKEEQLIYTNENKQVVFEIKQNEVKLLHI